VQKYRHYFKQPNKLTKKRPLFLNLQAPKILIIAVHGLLLSESGLNRKIKNNFAKNKQKI